MITYDESKREANIKNHRLDFIGCEVIFDGFTIVREDSRESYGEQRLQTLGLYKEQVAVRYDADILAYFRATGKGWQTRMNDALKEWLKEHAV